MHADRVLVLDKAIVSYKIKSNQIFTELWFECFSIKNVYGPQN